MMTLTHKKKGFIMSVVMHSRRQACNALPKFQPKWLKWKKIFETWRCELWLYGHGTVPSPIAIFLHSGPMKILVLYQVLFIYITSLWYVGQVSTVSILQMWKLRPGEINSMVELRFKPNSRDSKAHAFSTIPHSSLKQSSRIWTCRTYYR